MTGDWKGPVAVILSHSPRFCTFLLIKALGLHVFGDIAL